MHYHWRQQNGDTIVEVVIAVAIVATLLAGAFLVTNRSSRAVRDSEEHAQALQLLQGQVELLRHDAAVGGALPAALSTPFCLDASAYYASTDNHCQVNNLYQLSIVRSSASAGPTTTFDLTANWAALGGGTDTVYLSYKVAVTP